MRFGRRALRLHDRGDSVARLQEALQELGYDVGPIDGIFGYLTLDALRQFQREHRLAVDGKAGPEVWTTLFRPELRARREVHIVARGERLADVARRYGVSERFLRHTNRLTREHGLYEGRRLVIRSRYVVGAVDALAGAREADFTLRRIAGHVSALASLQFRVAPDGTLVGAWDDEAMAVCRGRGVEVLAVCRLSAADEPPRALLHRLLHNRKTRHACIEQWAEVLNRPDAGGLVVDLPGLLLGDGSRFVRFVQALSNAVHARGKRLIAGVPVPVRGIRGRLQLADVDWRRLAEAADGVLLQTHVPPPGAGAPPSPHDVRQWVRALCARVPRWKVVLGVSLGAWEGAPGSPLNELTYQQAVALAFGRGRRPVWDDRLQLHVGAYRTAGEQPEERDLWLFSAPAVAHYLQLVETYDLQGAFFWRIGGEDGRVWREVPHRVRVYRHAETDGGI